MTKFGHIYIIDDDQSMRTSLSRMLGEVGYTVNHYESGIHFLTDSLPISPAVILLDMQMPDMTGVQLQQKLLDLGRRTPIIFISGQSHPHEIVAGLKNGAIDFMFKPFNLEDLLVAVSNALELDKRQLIRLTKDLDSKQCFLTLTPREKEVCSLLVKGLINKEIAIQLGTVDATIKVHKARVMEKMNVDSLQALVRMYLEADLDNA
jgi:FixJ family two-component response regulator